MSGWMVSIGTLGGDQPEIRMFAARTEAEAVALVEKAVLPRDDQRVVAVAPLADEMMERLRLGPRECWS